MILTPLGASGSVSIVSGTGGAAGAFGLAPRSVVVSFATFPDGRTASAAGGRRLAGAVDFRDFVTRGASAAATGGADVSDELSERWVLRVDFASGGLAGRTAAVDAGGALDASRGDA